MCLRRSDGLDRPRGESRILQPASQALGSRDELLAGYMLLGRGMLGDGNIIDPGQKFLAVVNDKDDRAGILARRAGVLGLGLLRKPAAVPVLIQAWDLNYYVNREVALALSLADAHSATESLTNLLDEGRTPFVRAFAARCLGVLYSQHEPRRPPRLARLVNDSNFAMKNVVLQPFAAWHNECLIRYWLAPFEQTWW